MMALENIPRRSSNSSRKSSPRCIADPLITGYTAEDEFASTRVVGDALWAEFVENITTLVTLFMNRQPYKDADNALVHQIGAFKALNRSIHGDLFKHFHALDESDEHMRAFYIGCLHQLTCPNRVFEVSQ